MLPLSTSAHVVGNARKLVLKVLTPTEAAIGDWPLDSCLAFDPEGELSLDALHGWAGVLTYAERPAPAAWSGVWVSGLKQREVIAAGDVVRVSPERGTVHVLFRRGAKANFLFATDRCNNYCLMCSQPPLAVEDGWRVRDMIQTICLIDRDEKQLGITGGEPTLLGSGLADVLSACKTFLPDTFIHVLTNGRSFSDPMVVERLALVHPTKVTWAIPVYADNPQAHDHVVQAKGAFDETMRGLYNLGARGVSIEVRVVLHRLTVPRLGALSAFIYRSLPFVSHVALMGLEPMGFTPLNREQLWIDPLDYVDALREATFHLANRGVNVSIYNLPLCILQRDLWPFARQSISDWKNTLAEECGGCTAASGCAGFFKSAGPSWRSRGIVPFLDSTSTGSYSPSSKEPSHVS